MSFNVLLIDDEAGIVQALSRVFDNAGLITHTAHNLQDALEILRTHTIKVMITDFRMPGGDGLELCQQARELSPCTYRLLLSGHVEYPLLRAALQRGDVHKFAAKPWNNQALIRDVEEGARQSDLMKKVHALRSAVHDDQPAFLTDRNWVIRLANARLCTALGIPEEQLVGRNLFAPSICAMPVMQEAEITRQTESGQTWLGFFSLIDVQRQEIPTWMVVTALSQDYRICVCSFVDPDAGNAGREIRTELRRYSGSHQLDEFSNFLEDNYGMARTLLVEFPREMVNDADLSALCYERISAATGGLNRIFTPASNLFLIPLADSHADDGVSNLEDAIRRQFSAPLVHRRQVVQVTPTLRIESSNDDQPFASLRSKLTHYETLEAPEKSLSGTNITPVADVIQSATQPAIVHSNGPDVLPIFDHQGHILGVRTCRPESRPDSWIQLTLSCWQQYLQAAPFLAIDMASGDPLPNAPQTATCLLEFNVSMGLPEALQNPSEEFVRRGFQLLLRNPSQQLLASRQLANLPIRAIAFGPRQLQEMMGAEAGFRRLLQKWQEQGVQFLGEQLNSPTELANARHWGMDWLCGDALSKPVKASRLSWFANVDGF